MPFLQMTDVAKRYGGVQALRGATLSLERGEVHGLLGPNGSGKSTLSKVLAGTVAPDRGRIEIDGEKVQIRGPMDAYRHGIAAVYQQLSLVADLTVGQNLLLGVEPTRAGFVSDRAARARSAGILRRFSPAFEGRLEQDTTVATLSPGDQQVVEIAKAVLREPRILILDEATASLHRDQVALVFGVLGELGAREVTVVFVSHRLNEILDLCTRATILRSGETVATRTVADTDERELVHLMVGDVAAPPARADSPPGDSPVVLRVSNLSSEKVHDVSFDARAGEVVGLGGLQGQGQSELLLTLFGAVPHSGGTVAVRGTRQALRGPGAAARAGIALVPGDRGSQGIFPPRTIQENISIASLPRRARALVGVSPRAERDAARAMVDRLRIQLGRLTDAVSSLSGGNQQKVIIAKWLLTQPSVILLDDPTKGVDIAAKAEIYRIIRELTDAGATVVFNSSDDHELADIADRVLVLYEGRVRGELRGAQITVDALVTAALVIGHDEVTT